MHADATAAVAATAAAARDCCLTGRVAVLSRSSGCELPLLVLMIMQTLETGVAETEAGERTVTAGTGHGAGAAKTGLEMKMRWIGAKPGLKL